MKTGQWACRMGIGLAAGIAGTAAITVSQKIDRKLRKREASNTPAKAVEKVFGIEPKSEKIEERLSNLTHWDYGTLWGLFLPVAQSIGLRGGVRGAAHWAAVQGTAMTLLPGLGVAPPVRKWGMKEIVIEAVHHLVYVITAGLAYTFLMRRVSGEGRVAIASALQDTTSTTMGNGALNQKTMAFRKTLLAGLGAAAFRLLSKRSRGSVSGAAGVASGFLARQAIGSARETVMRKAAGKWIGESVAKRIPFDALLRR